MCHFLLGGCVAFEANCVVVSKLCIRFFGRCWEHLNTTIGCIPSSGGLYHGNLLSGPL